MGILPIGTVRTHTIMFSFHFFVFLLFSFFLIFSKGNNHKIFTLHTYFITDFTRIIITHSQDQLHIFTNIFIRTTTQIIDSTTHIHKNYMNHICTRTRMKQKGTFGWSTKVVSRSNHRCNRPLTLDPSQVNTLTHAKRRRTRSPAGGQRPRRRGKKTQHETSCPATPIELEPPPLHAPPVPDCRCPSFPGQEPRELTGVKT
jgi:hypothetical protein